MNDHPPPPPPPPPPAPPPHPGHPRTYVLGAGGRGDQEPLHPQAMRAFALGMIAVIGTFFLLLPVLLSPVAWWTGARAVREIDAEPDAWSGRGLAQTGKVLGMVGTALIALVVAAVVVVVRLLVNA